MSWSSGADLAERLWKTVRDKLDPIERVVVARKWVDAFEDRNCDNLIGTTLGDDAGVITDEEEGSRWEWR